MNRILIINGPNLNLLGRRQPEIYGHTTMAEILDGLNAEYPQIQIDYYQSNHEGDIIDRLQEAGYGPEKNRPDGIILNAGGYTHTSVAIADAVAAIDIPVIEVHLSDVANREPFRRHSYLTPVCRATITALGPAVYSQALKTLKDLKDPKDLKRPYRP